MGSVKQYFLNLWHWWTCCRKSTVWYVYPGYKQCMRCGAIYER